VPSLAGVSEEVPAGTRSLNSVRLAPGRQIYPFQAAPSISPPAPVSLCSNHMLDSPSYQSHSAKTEDLSLSPVPGFFDAACFGSASLRQRLGSLTLITLTLSPAA
jgi:hypothetical protein